MTNMRYGFNCSEQSVPYLKVMKPHCHCNQLASCEALKEWHDNWEDHVEEGQGGHRPSREGSAL